MTKAMPQPSERWERVNSIFDDAVELAEPERARFLEQECGDDRELRAEVDSLLASDAEASQFIEDPPLALPRELFPEDRNDPAGQQLGAYRIIREIGRGGLGTVYLAERADESYRKEVAIKLVRRGLDTEDILQRFRHERQILAQLEHPNIARLIDGGTTEDGRPFFVMEYVQGETLIKYCEAKNLAIDERLKIFRKVCQAVSYAHQNLVIHRDLKPSNILVIANGVPKLLDFGIAKVLTADEEAFTQTIPSLRVMTPEYASPEQVKGDRITTASDVYSLGVILYELLTGQKPYRLTSRTPEEISRAITEQGPERPSRHQQVKINDRKSLRGDLDNIVLMALRKEPERRYASVERFSEDIRRHLEGLPVLAHKDTFAYRSAKFVRRNKIGVAAAIFVLLTLLGGIVATTWQARRATAQAAIAAEQAREASAERDRARREETKAQSVSAFLQNILRSSDPSGLSVIAPGNVHRTTVAEVIDSAAERVDAELGGQPEVLAAVKFVIGKIYATQGRGDRAESLLRESLEIRRKVLGPDHPETAQSMAILGEQINTGQRYAESEPLLREAVAIFRRDRARGAADQMSLAAALSGLGLAQIAKGESATGEQFLLESLQACETLQGSERVTIPIALNNLSILRGEQGDVNGARTYLERCLEEFRRTPGDMRFRIAAAFSNLAFLLVLQREYPQAEAMLRESIDLYRATVGEENQKATWPMIHLANLHYLRGDYRPARETIDRAIEIQKRVLSEGHVDFARSALVLGKILTRTDDAASGEIHLRKALELRRRTFAEGHWRTAEVQMALGECLAAQARQAEARELAVASHTALMKKLGPQDPRTREAHDFLVQLKKTLGEREPSIDSR